MGWTHDDHLRCTQELCSFIRSCPSPYHVVANMRSRFDDAGFSFVPETESWHLERSGSYYTTRGGTSIIAFRIGQDVDEPSFRIVASHSDSPTYRVKPVAELAGPGPYLRLDVEGYGGMIERSWLDRPLSLAGRVMVATDDRIRPILFAPDEDLLLVPSVAIHLNRDVNKGGPLNRQVDLCPLVSAGALGKDSFKAFLAERLGVRPNDVLAFDLVLVNRQEPTIWGAAKEFVSAPRLDDLQCTFAALTAFMGAQARRSVSVIACFDSEEVGSGTQRGALSTFLPDVLRRICNAIGGREDDYPRSIHRSFLVSCDNAHAVHPNHPELHDEVNRSWLNQGVVIKETASQRYATDARSRALFCALCHRAQVPVQTFSNRSDMPGGSTLGNLLMRQASLPAVDVGLPQLSMHSAFETSGTSDTAFLARALSEVFEANLTFASDDSIILH